ncbi:MAG: phosphoesterase, partial [Verrucomicrobia bacterium]|nr:phosphoesterase [Verrucomicrobiota bacterium]
RLLVTSGKTAQLVVVDPVTGSILQRVPLPSEAARSQGTAAVSSHILAPDKGGQASYTGLVFSPDGTRLYLSNVNGSIKVFGVNAAGRVSGLYSIALPPSGLTQRTNDIPAGLAISRDGRRLYVALNLSNRLLELDPVSGATLRLFDVGVAPYAVALVGRKVYVSNWGGRRPDAASTLGPAGQGTLVRVDPVRFIANEGSVSVIDLDRGRVMRELVVGLHACALATTPDGRWLVAANAASDTVSVISTRTDRVVRTVSLRWHPQDLFGASPNALAFDTTGKKLFVCNGTQNAVAVLAFRPRDVRWLGLIPTGWFPGAIVWDARRHALDVANIKGVGSGKRFGPGQKIEYNSHQYFGSLSLIPLPDRRELARDTATVLRNYGEAVMAAAQLPARPDAPPRPVPERAGEPSPIKHVIYIIKENRTYDQVLGDIREGDGDPSLCVFGERVTPNQHQFCREFVLLDNTYCSGILSADGHQWTDSAFATDYMEKSFADFPRSYPDGMEDADIDALAYASSGFIWDNALAHGKTLRDYGEFTIGVTGWRRPGYRKAPPGFLDFYHDFTQGTRLTFIGCRPAIDSLGPHMNTDTIGWDLDVPDVFRAAKFIAEWRQFERAGRLPQLLIFCLPNDHTSGTKPHSPTPAAQVADNDLAFGQIVEAVSHSPFWKETAIFAIEDDPQAGYDHVNSFRTTAYVISPFARRHTVIHNNYNHTSLVRTIELILGLPPMNQLDATATPMSACFTDQPDFTPFTALPNHVPLDQMNPETQAIADPLQRRYAAASARLPLAKPDQCPEDLLNRILWVAQKGSRAPYPTWAITPHARADKD